MMASDGSGKTIAPWDTWAWDIPAGTTSDGLADGVERTTAELIEAARAVGFRALRR